ncbi:DUF3667 domain-containing protein [Gaopeijia maritima]|uniref:DUF3667 domain-containing protein n=1 Tax=Gaopeijia maritima TaxID=3119007 RepID=A0ABU9EAD9_9BACT
MREADESTRCFHCGAGLHGRWCSSCGADQRPAPVQTIRGLLAEGFRSAFDLDSSLWRSLRLLCLRPGELTRRFMAGRRFGLLGPVRLFLFANLVYFFVQPYTGYDGFNTSLAAHLDRQPYSEALDLRSRVSADIDRRARSELGGAAVDPALWRATSAAWQAEFDARGQVIARSAVGLMIPALALVLALMLRGKGAAGVRHLVFATHHFAWYLLAVMSFFLPLLALGHGALGLGDPEVLSLPVAGAISVMLLEAGGALLQGPWAWVGLRRAYGLSGAAAAWRALALVLATLVATTAFRLVVFGLTWAAMR